MDVAWSEVLLDAASQVVCKATFAIIWAAFLHGLFIRVELDGFQAIVGWRSLGYTWFYVEL
jgi:hypothetical protein